MTEDRLTLRWRCGRTHLHIYLCASLLLGTATVNRFIYLLFYLPLSLSLPLCHSLSLRGPAQMRVNYSIPFVFCILSLRAFLFIFYFLRKMSNKTTPTHTFCICSILTCLIAVAIRHSAVEAKRNGREKKIDNIVVVAQAVGGRESNDGKNRSHLENDCCSFGCWRQVRAERTAPLPT